MPNNLHVTFKQGEVGKELNFTLSDAAGLYDLTNWTVTLAIAEKPLTTPALTGLAVTKRTQSGATLGQCYHALTAQSAALSLGGKDHKEYKACELKLVNGSQVRYWPVDGNNQKTYFTIEVQKAIS